MKVTNQSRSAKSLVYTLPIDHIPLDGLSVHFELGDYDRAKLEQTLELVALEDLAANLEVLPLGQGSFRVLGKLSASVTQNCVLSLDPVMSVISEHIDVEFRPRLSADAEKISAFSGDSDDQDILTSKEVEGYDAGKLELGALISEIVTSAIDSYPRKPGVQFASTHGGGVDQVAERSTTGSPFSKLASLKADTETGKSDGG